MAAAGTWTATTPLTFPRGFLGAAVVGRYLYVVGGANGCGLVEATKYATVERAEVLPTGPRHWVSVVPPDPPAGAHAGGYGRHPSVCRGRVRRDPDEHGRHDDRVGGWLCGRLASGGGNDGGPRRAGSRYREWEALLCWRPVRGPSLQQRGGGDSDGWNVSLVAGDGSAERGAVPGRGGGSRRNVLGRRRHRRHCELQHHGASGVRCDRSDHELDGGGPHERCPRCPRCGGERQPDLCLRGRGGPGRRADRLG